MSSTQVIERIPHASSKSLLVSPNEEKPPTVTTTTFSPNSPSRATVVTVAIFMGLVFGWMIQKGQVFLPRVIVNQMLLKDFTMVKFFLTTGATSMFSLTLLWIVGGEARKKVEFAQETYASGDRGITATLLGAFILGCGMAVGGACPGTVFVQFGSGIVYSLFTLLGGFLGASAYGMLDPALGRLKQHGFILTEKGSLNRAFQVAYPVVAIPMVLFMAAVVAMLEIFFPYHYKAGNYVLDDVSWPPYITGIFLGMLQIPGLLFLRKMIGASSSFTVLVSTAFCTLGGGLCNGYFSKARGAQLAMWWQNIYVAAATLGGAISAILAHSTYWTTSGSTVAMNPGMAIFGGFLILFGARLANGCTSGHGISGFSALAIKSILSVPAMFIGGIITAFFLRAVHAYPISFLG